MNFKDKRTRRICAASASAAVIVAGGVTVGASMASAGGSLTTSLGSGTTINTLDVGSTIAGGNLAAALADATFGINVSTAISGTRQITVDSYTAPTGITFAAAGQLSYAVQATNLPHGPAAGWNPLTTGTATDLSGILTTDSVFLTADKPGTYHFHISDTMGTPGTDDDATTGDLTLNVKDVENVAVASGTATADDWKPTVSVPATADSGAPLTATVDLGSLRLVDSRASSGGKGVLADGLAGLLGLGFVGGGLNDAAGTGITLGTTTGTRSLAPLATSGTGTLTTTVYVDSNGDGTIDDAALNTGTTTLTSNNTTGLGLLAGTGQDANLSGTGVNTILRPGVDTFTYKATATGASSTKIAGATVWFTLAGSGGVALTDLTANGAAVPSTGYVPVVTGSDGAATLVVRSAKTANGNAYSIHAETNGQSGPAITATYTTPVASAIVTGGNAAVAVGGTAMLTGHLTDQWSQPFSPANAGQATLTVTRNASSVGAADFTHVVEITNGAFSYALPDTASNTAARTDAYEWDAGSLSSSGGDKVKWLTATAAGSAALTSLTDHNSVAVDSTNLADLAAASAAPDASVQNTLTGTVSDSSNNVLPYTSFTLTGTPGVWFVDEGHSSALVTTLTARTSATGELQSAADQSGHSVKVIVTKPGAATITLTAGTVVKTLTFSAKDATDAYTVTVTNVTGISGKNITVGGKVTDGFGNPVSGAQVDLALTANAFGAFLSSATPTTDSSGSYSAVFISGQSDNGTVSYTATLHTQVANKTPDAGWATGGVTLSDGVYKATGTIKVGAETVTISAPASRVGAGRVTLTGTAAQGASVDIYARPSGGALTLVDTVTANSLTGAWRASESISSTTTFVARTLAATSLPVTVHVKSTVRIAAKATRGGVVKLTVSGGPSHKGTIVVYITHGKKVTKVVLRVTGGIKTWALKPGKGVTSFRAMYTSTGCDASSWVSARVTVK